MTFQNFLVSDTVMVDLMQHLNGGSSTGQVRFSNWKMQNVNAARIFNGNNGQLDSFVMVG